MCPLPLPCLRGEDTAFALHVPTTFAAKGTAFASRSSGPTAIRDVAVSPGGQLSFVVEQSKRETSAADVVWRVRPLACALLPHWTIRRRPSFLLLVLVILVIALVIFVLVLVILLLLLLLLIIIITEC